MARSQQLSNNKIVNLGSLIELKLVDILQDGRHAIGDTPSSYVVEVRRKSDGARASRSAGKCVLKTFPGDKRNQEVFSREFQAYSRLIGPVANNTGAEEAADALFDSLTELKPKAGWPRCLGELTVPTGVEDYEFEWTDMTAAAASKGSSQKALLLEFIPGLQSVKPDELNATLVDDILDVLAQLHEQGVNHRANINPAVWPRVGLRNIHVRYGKPGLRGTPFITNFGNAHVLGSSKNDQKIKDQEMEDLKYHLERGLEGKLLVDEVPREVQVLLDDAR